MKVSEIFIRKDNFSDLFHFDVFLSHDDINIRSATSQFLVIFKKIGDRNCHKPADAKYVLSQLVLKVNNSS